MKELDEILARARAASRVLATSSAEQRRRALELAAEGLLAAQSEILAANAADLARAQHLSAAMRDRLTLSPQRLAAMADGCRAVAAQPEVIGHTIAERSLASGANLRQIAVPLGVVAIIYEARPNVTADAAALCLKSANAVVLKGGSEACESNRAIARVLAKTCEAAKFAGAVGFLSDSSREAAMALMQAEGRIDALIPRGGAALIEAARTHARVPLIATGVGNCHIYVHQSADLAMALRVLKNAKMQRPSVCNAAETLLLDAAIAGEFMPQVLAIEGLKVLGCEKISAKFGCEQASVSDFASEALAPVLCVREVAGIAEAIAHIARYGSGHSEAIIARDEAAAERFAAEVDAACVYHNASTRFSDGECFGLGAEIGISTQKLHARGPMGAAALTTYKYLITGCGQVRE